MNNVKALFITAFTAATLGLAAPQTAHAGGVYVNGNGGGAVVVNGGGRYYGPGGYYNAPAYYGGRGYVQGPNGACARGYYGRGGCVRY